MLGRCWDPQNYLDVGLGTSSGTLMGQGGDRVDMGCLQPQPLFCEDPQKQPSTRPCPITKPRPSVPQKKIHIEHFSRICTPKICHGTASPSALHPLRLQILGGDLPKEEGSRRSSSCGTPRVMLLPMPTPPSSSWLHEMPPKQVSLEKKKYFQFNRIPFKTFKQAELFLFNTGLLYHVPEETGFSGGTRGFRLMAGLDDDDLEGFFHPKSLVL